MKDNGTLPDSFKDAYEELKSQFGMYNYNPPAPLVFSWKAYWEIRRTKPYENPINHSDLLSYSTLKSMEWDLWEIQTLLQWDREYYAAINEKKG